MRKPWTIRLERVTGVGPLAYIGDLQRFWTLWGAARYCRKVNEKMLLTTARWVPVKTRRQPW